MSDKCSQYNRVRKIAKTIYNKGIYTRDRKFALLLIEQGETYLNDFHDNAGIPQHAFLIRLCRRYGNTGTILLEARNRWEW